MLEHDQDPSATSGFTRRSFLAATASAGVTASALGLAACGSSNSSSAASSTSTSTTPAFTPGPSSAGTPVRGGTLTVGVVTNGSSETISPPAAYNVADFVRIYNLYDPLFFPAANGGVTPGLVTSAEPSADAKMWTLHLRQGVVWHNGKGFDADDVVYTIQHSWGSPKNLYNGVLATVVDFNGVKKLDQYTVQVPLKVGLAQFPQVTCFVNCYVVQNGTTNFSDGNGTGPFTLNSFTAGSSSNFSANRNYWIEGRPYVDTLVVNSSFASDTPRLNALLAGSIDIAPGADATIASAYARAGRLVMGNQPGPGFVAPVCRVDKAPFSDPRVRKALKLISARPQYVETVYSNYGSVSNDCPGYTDQYWAADLKRYQDLEQARSLLKAAGQENAVLTLDTSDVVPGQLDTAVLFKQQAAGAGLTVNIRQFPAATYFTSADGLLERSWSVTYYSTGVNALSVFYLTSMLPTGLYNESHWGGSAQSGANALLYDAMAEIDTAKATDKWHAVQELQFEEGPYVISGTSNWVDAYTTQVRGVETSSAFNCNNYDFTNGWLATS